MAEKPIILPLEATTEAVRITHEKLKDKFDSIAGGPCVWTPDSAFAYLSGVYSGHFPVDVVYMGFPTPFHRRGMESSLGGEFVSTVQKYADNYLNALKDSSLNLFEREHERNLRSIVLVNGIKELLEDKGIPMVIADSPAENRNWEIEIPLLLDAATKKYQR